MIWASEALAVLVVVLLVLVLVPVEVVELEVAAAVAGREESFASVYEPGIDGQFMFHVDRTWSFERRSEKRVKTLTACLKTWKLV